MPRKICVDCGDEYGRYRWTELKNELPCPTCAQRRRQTAERQAAATLERDQEDAQQARQLTLRQADNELEVQKTKEVEETKQLAIKSGEKARKEEFEHKLQLAEIEAKCKEEQQRLQEKDIDMKVKVRLEEEKTKQFEREHRAKKEQMEEKTKHLELEYKIKNKEAELQVKLAQEHTKRVRAETEEKRKTIEAEELTKQLSTIVNKLGDSEDDKAYFRSLLSKVLGESPSENQRKTNLPSTPSTTPWFEQKTKFKVSQQKSDRQIRTAPV